MEASSNKSGKLAEAVGAVAGVAKARKSGPESAAPQGSTVSQLVRRPSQERGRRRFDAILDAAAAILVESGLAGFTVHGVAARAYVHWVDVPFLSRRRECVARAGERHMEALGALLRGLRETDDAVWASLPLDSAVAAVLDPLVAYMEGHPDLFALPHDQHQHDGCEPDAGGLDQMSIEIFERFIGARMPGAPPAVRQLRARVVHAIAEGVAMRAAQYPVAERSPLFQELRVAVSAYLGRV